jgi:hypothetical protein
MEGEGLVPASHRHDQPLAAAHNRLGGPGHRAVLLGVVGIAMARVALAELLDGLDIGEELLADQLDRLAVQAVLPTFGFPMQVVAVWPTALLAAGLLVTLEAVPPDVRGFLLRRSQARSGPPVEMLESIDPYGMHGPAPCSAGSSRAASPV